MFGCDKYNIKPDLVSVAKVDYTTINSGIYLACSRLLVLKPLSSNCVYQALSSAYMPIGAILVSPEVADVVHSQSNKLGIFNKKNKFY